MAALSRALLRGSVHVPTPPIVLERMAALVIEMNLDAILICEPTPISDPPRVHVLLFSWLGENMGRRAMRSMHESDSVFSSILHPFAMGSWADQSQTCPRLLDCWLPAEFSQGHNISESLFPAVPGSEQWRLLPGFLILLDRCLCWLWLLPGDTPPTPPPPPL